MYPDISNELPPVAAPDQHGQQQKHVVDHGMSHESLGGAPAEKQLSPSFGPPIAASSVAAPQASPPIAHTPQAQHSAGGALASMPAIADDTDLIEKEWVLKAKRIVEMTKRDPHQQNNALQKVKADYMSKRYGKELKLSEG